MLVGIVRQFVHRFYCYYRYLVFRLRVLVGAETFDRSQLDGLPLPSPPLRYRVHGSIKPDGFMRVGRECARDISARLGEHGYELTSFRRILDFGCGCGRVLRFFDSNQGACSLYGTDIDDEAVRWCKKNLPYATWGVNQALPPTNYEDNFFDFVFALSVFTHLNEEFQDKWLMELRRILRPQGILLATVHGTKFAERLPEQRAQQVTERGILNTVGQTGALKVDGLPDYYQTTYHNRNYIERRWGQIFEIVDYKERGMNDDQDVVLLRKPVLAN